MDPAPQSLGQGPWAHSTPARPAPTTSTRLPQAQQIIPKPSRLVPGPIKARPTRWLEAERLLQVGAAVVVGDLPEVQATVVQQGQEAALVDEQRQRPG